MDRFLFMSSFMNAAPPPYGVLEIITSLLLPMKHTPKRSLEISIRRATAPSSGIKKFTHKHLFRLLLHCRRACDIQGCFYLKQL